MSLIPDAPTFDAAELRTRLNLKEGESDEIFALAVLTVNRELVGAFRDVPGEVYDDLVRRVAGAIKGAQRRPAGGNGQLTRTDQAEPGPPAPRDYAAPIRAQLALYVSPL